jgi:hypothetical protein
LNSAWQFVYWAVISLGVFPKLAASASAFRPYSKLPFLNIDQTS